jgi:hypothetical protein
VGSVLLEVRLRESLEHLSTRFRVAVPENGRHAAALETLGKWNKTDRSIDLSDHGELRRLTEAHRLAWETFLVTVAAIEDRRNTRTPFISDKLRLMLDGDLVLEGRRGLPRDTQFELFLAAMLRLGGLSVARGGPDLLMRYGTTDVGVAAKRIRSLNVDQVQKNARDAAKQIKRAGLRGWIALNLDSRFGVIDYAQPEDSLLVEFSDTFNSVNAALQRPAVKPHVLGFILLGYVHSWHPPLKGTTEPRLHWAAPLRWQGLADNPQDEALFHAFTDGWSQRWTTNRTIITSRDFTGQL